MHFINAMLFVALTLTSPLQETYSTEWNKKSTLSTDYEVYRKVIFSAAWKFPV